MTTSDTINLSLLALTALGVACTLRQVFISNKQKRADLILQLYHQFSNDKGMQDAYFEIEYDKFVYSNNFHGSALEPKIDTLLGLFSNIGQLYEMGIIKDADLEFLKYEFQIIYQNKGIRDYLKFLDGYFDEIGIKHLKYYHFRKVGKMIVERNGKLK